MATLTATRNVSQASTDTTLVRDVASDMVLLEPDATPLLVMTNNAKRKDGSKTPKFEWVEDSEVSFWGQSDNTTNVSTTATTFQVVDSTLFAVGDLISPTLAISNSAAEEVLLVTAIPNTTVLQVTRAIGGSGGAPFGSSTAIRIISSAFQENSTLPAGRYTAKVVQVSGCQLFRTVVDISNTMISSEQFGAPDGEEKLQLAKALIRHKSEIEAAGLWGRFSETLAAPNSRWTSMGFKSRVATNVTDAGTTVTLSKWNDFSETAFRFGEPTKLLIAAPKVISAINFFSQARLLTKTMDSVFGVRIQRFETPHGTFMLARNFRMENGIANQPGFADEAYSIDLPSIRYRYLNGNGISRDTKLFQNVIQDGTDGKKDEYKTQAGWEIRHERKHARMFDVNAYA